MSDGKDQERVRLSPVDQVVREAAEKPSAQALGPDNGCPKSRLLSDQAHGTFHLIRELLSQSVRLLFVVRHRREQFGACFRVKDYAGHLDAARASANT